MVRAAVWLATVLAVPGFAGCLDASEVQDVERPAWSPGLAFAWSWTEKSQWEEEYIVDGQAPERDSGERSQGPSIGVREVMSDDVRVSGEPVYLGVAGDDDGSRFLFAYRQADLRPLPVRYYWDRDCSDAGCEYEFEILGRSGPPRYSWLDFPLTTGKSWSGEVPAEQRDFGDLKWEFRAEVGGSRLVETQVGAVEAVRVTITERPVNLDEVREAVAQSAREDEGALEEFDYSASRRYQLDYAPELGLLVGMAFDEQEQVFVSGQDDGESFSYRGKEVYEEEWTLAGLQKTSRPARDLDYVVRALAGEISLADPTGVLPSPRDVQLSVDPSKGAANAAVGEEVTFSAQATEDGRDAVGVDLRWRLLDHANDPVASGEGGQIAWMFDEPGLYSVQAAAYDANDTDSLLAAVEVPFEAYFDGQITLTNPAGFFGIPSTATESIPVRPGIRELRLTASPPVAGPFDELVVEDAESDEVEDADGDAHRVHVTDFSDSVIGSPDWSVVWASWVDAATVVPVHVEMRYATGPLQGDASVANETVEPSRGAGRVPWLPDAASGGLLA